MPLPYDRRSAWLYRRHVDSRARFIRMLAREMAKLRGQERICPCIIQQAMDFANRYFTQLENSACDWGCDNRPDAVSNGPISHAGDTNEPQQ